MKKGFCCFLLLLLAMPLTALAGSTPPTADQAALQMGDEVFEVAGLDGEVTIRFDSFDVPHIYATTTHDLVFAQGYLHAANRWWQMEWFRHQGAGRLSELMGDSLLGTDTFLRTFGLKRNAEREFANMDAEAKTILEDYAAGVNAWLEGKAPGDLAIEYNFVQLLAGEITVEPWTPIDTLLWVQSMMFDQERSDLAFELEKGAITQQAGPLGALVLVPPYPYDLFPIITDPGFTPPTALPDVPAAAAVAPVRQTFSLPTAFLFEGVGSNSWVVSGELTDTGKPYLANDPHIGIQNPPIWYQNGLHCIELSDACAFDLYGYSFAGVPLIVIGHNQHIGWGLTNSGLDSMDIYSLELNPDNPLQYSYDGEFVDMEVINEEIKVAGADPVVVPVRLTRFGPVIHELVGFDQPMAVRWVAYDDVPAFSVFASLGKAANWDDFQAAVERFPIGQNFIYADVEGNIGLISGGHVPIRAAGHDGSLPMPGVDGTFEWQGFMDPAELPRIFNPEEGYIVAANNPTVRPEDYGTVYSTYYDVGYRAARIEELIQASDVIDLARMAEIQYDSHNPSAEFMIPVLAEMSFDDPQLQAAVAIMQEWDRMDTVDSTGAVIYNAFWAKLVALVFDELPSVPSGDAKEVYIISTMLAGEHPLWKNAALGTSDPDELITLALRQGLDLLTEMFGDEMTTWTWGEAHLAKFNHRPLGELPAGINVGLDIMLNDIYHLFNRSIPTTGGLTAVNRMAWNAGSGDFVIRNTIASMRQILDFSDWDNSKYVHSLGQSGDPRSDHYDDMMALWAAGEYLTHGYTADAVDSITQRTWTLTP